MSIRSLPAVHLGEDAVAPGVREDLEEVLHAVPLLGQGKSNKRAINV